MTYDERLRMVAAWLNTDGGLLSRFKPPQGFGEAQIKREMLAIADAVNKTIPTGLWAEDVRVYLGKVETIIAENAQSRSWPLIKDFKDAGVLVSRDAIKAGALQLPSPDGGGRDISLAWAARMNDGQPCAVNYIYGQRSRDLIRRGLVKIETVAEYQQSYEHSLRQTYRGEAQRMIDAARAMA